MSNVVKIDAKKLKKRDYSYESYVNEGKKIKSTSAPKKDSNVLEKKVEVQKKEQTPSKTKVTKSTNTKAEELDLTTNDKNDPKIVLLTIIAIVLGIMVGIAVLLTKMFD